MKKFYFLSLTCILCLISSCNENISPIESITNKNLVLENTDEFKEAKSLSAKGEQKLLVVPVEFEGEREFSEKDLSTIKKAFFEDELSTKGNNYYSVKEFYKKSSKGQLNFVGDVIDVLKVPYTVDQMKNDGNYFPGVPAQHLMDDSKYSDDFFKQYDTDKDGFVDSVVFVYSSPTSERAGNFWAWVANFNVTANLDRPTFFRHMWCGIDFFYKGGYDVDAHTIIHETGHLLGLRDYYPSDDYNLALGGHSMMDYNISDHDPYSKMLLSWAEPIYYDFRKNKHIDLQLSNLQDTSQFLLLNVNWNHSVMDEYLLVEYYTPTGLNTLDSQNQYDNRPLGFTENGVKIYHVDSRIVQCHYDSELYTTVFDKYVDEIPETSSDGVYYVIGASNSISDSRTDAKRAGRYKQIALIENKKYNQLQSGVPADNDSLFQVGDIFDSETSAYIANNKWNKGGDISFSLEVTQMNDEYATLSIDYKGE